MKRDSYNKLVITDNKLPALKEAMFSMTGLSKDTPLITVFGRVINTLITGTKLNPQKLLSIISRLEPIEIIRNYSGIYGLKKSRLSISSIVEYANGLTGKQLIRELKFIPNYSIVPICPNDKQLLKQLHTKHKRIDMTDVELQFSIDKAWERV